MKDQLLFRFLALLFLLLFFKFFGCRAGFFRLFVFYLYGRGLLRGDRCGGLGRLAMVVEVVAALGSGRGRAVHFFRQWRGRRVVGRRGGRLRQVYDFRKFLDRDFALALRRPLMVGAAQVDVAERQPQGNETVQGQRDDGGI